MNAGTLARLACTVTCAASAACASHIRQQHVGSARAHAATSAGDARVIAGVPVIEAGSDYRIDFAIQMPRAVELRYAIDCPGGSRKGVAGERWESYRARRIEELERERREDAEAIAGITGAVLGSAGVRATVETPATQGTVEAGVDGEAAGGAVAEAVLPEVTLPPGDIGARTVQDSFRVHASEAGQCTMALWSDSADQDVSGVIGSFDVVQLIDMEEVRRERRAAANAVALQARVDLVANLVAQGADPERVARERARRAQIEAEVVAQRARRKAERDAERARVKAERGAVRARIKAEKWRRSQLEIELKVRERNARRHRALVTRGHIVAWLTDCGADPTLRARQESARRARERYERNAQIAREQTQTTVDVSIDESPGPATTGVVMTGAAEIGARTVEVATPSHGVGAALGAVTIDVGASMGGGMHTAVKKQPTRDHRGKPRVRDHRK